MYFPFCRLLAVKQSCKLDNQSPVWLHGWRGEYWYMYFQSLRHHWYPARTNLSIINRSVYLYFNLKSALLSITKQQGSSCLCHMIAILLVVYNFAINIIFLPGHGILHLIYENIISASKQTYNTLLFQWGKFARGSFDQRTRVFL